MFLSGCVLEYREGLPAVITISEMPKQEMESMLCDSPPCATLVQMSQIKRTQYVCSSQTKGANDDPRGTTYNTQLGGDCTPLEKPTTVCLKYDCDFNKEEGLGYYEIEMIIGNSGSDKTKKLPYTGVALPYEKLVSNFRGGSLGRYGEDNIDFYYSFLDNQYKTGKYSNEIKIESKNYRSLSFYTEQKCLANMPIKYPYNSIDFAYNPIFESERNKDDPTKILRNLQTDYTYLSDYTSSFLVEDGEVKPVEDPCSELCNSVR